MLRVNKYILCSPTEQSGTKPKMAAKILATNSEASVHGLTKLEANISSQFQDFVEP